MVCHIPYCLEKGEKAIRENLVKLCIVLPVLVATLTMLFSDNLRDTFMCNGTEEILRFNINNFLEDVSYNENSIILPLHHPYRILGLFIGKLEKREQFQIIGH